MMLLPGSPCDPRGRGWRWADARTRAALLTEPFRTDFGRLFAHVERMDGPVHALEQAVENACAKPCPPGMEHLLCFAGQDVVDLFHSAKLSVAALVPGSPSWMEDADPSEADGHASLFDRYARVLVSARPPAAWPHDLSTTVAHVGESVEGWYDEFRARLAVVEETVFRVLRAADPPDEADEAPPHVRHRMEN